MMIWITSSTAFANWFVQMSHPWMQWPQAVNVEQIQLFSKQNNDLQLATDKGLLKLTNQPSSQAIVVLGGGSKKGALEHPEMDLQDVSNATFERLRMAARLSRHTHLPILVTGGRPDASELFSNPEGQLMAKVLKKELGVSVKWIEDQSLTTQENAVLTYKILQNEGISRIYLVTHFWHMPRAKAIFEKQGLIVDPIPTSFAYMNTFDWKNLNPLDFLPQPGGLSRVREIWHEILGVIWYRVRF